MTTFLLPSFSRLLPRVKDIDFYSAKEPKGGKGRGRGGKGDRTRGEWPGQGYEQELYDYTKMILCSVPVATLLNKTLRINMLHRPAET